MALYATRWTAQESAYLVVVGPRAHGDGGLRPRRQPSDKRPRQHFSPLSFAFKRVEAAIAPSRRYCCT